jgi:hypothetical protein
VIDILSEGVVDGGGYSNSHSRWLWWTWWSLWWPWFAVAVVGMVIHVGVRSSQCHCSTLSARALATGQADFMFASMLAVVDVDKVTRAGKCGAL